MARANSEVPRADSPSQRRAVRMRRLRIIVGAVAFPAALLLPAGRLIWPEAWAFLIVFFATLLCLPLT